MRFLSDRINAVTANVYLMNAVTTNIDLSGNGTRGEE